MASLHVFVCLMGLVVLCQSACYILPLQFRGVRNPPRRCVDEHGTEHDLGSKWSRDCKSCSCTLRGMSCCDKILDDVMDIPDDCELVVNKEACTVKVVMKSDKTKDCNPV